MRLGTDNRQQNVYEQAERKVWKGRVAGSVGLNDLSLLTDRRCRGSEGQGDGGGGCHCAS